MSPRERIINTARGGIVDRPAWFLWQTGASANTLLEFASQWAPDLLVAKDVHDAQVLLKELPEEGPAVLVEVQNPFLEAFSLGLTLSQSFRQCPIKGDQELKEFVNRVRENIQGALDAGVDGIFYRLGGANPHHASPMEYSGFYLEHDHTLLSEITEARFNVLFVEGEEDPYLDVVHELPASALMWEDDSAWEPEKVRAFHSGALVINLWRDLPEEWGRLGKTGVLFGARVLDMSAMDLSGVVGQISSLREDKKE